MKKILTYITGAALSLALLPQYLFAQTVTGAHSVQCTAYAQERTQWCWAGVTRMVDWTYSSTTPPSQCSIVNAANNTCDGWFNTCCNTLDGSRPSACTDPAASNFPNSMYGCNGSLSWLINNYAGANSTTANSLSYSTVSSNLANNKMMVARWGWTSGGGHFVAIYACYQLNYVGQVQYADPGSGSKKTETHAYFTSNSSRTWTHSLTMNGAAYRPRYGAPATHDEVAQEASLEIYPNPSAGEVNLKRIGDYSEPVHVSISNSIGEVVHQSTINGNEQDAAINFTEKLSPGVYLLNFSISGVTQTRKLVIQ